MRRKVIFLSVLLLFGVYLVSAQQNLTVSGVVTDASDGSPLVGVSVVIKGATTGTITNLDGKYSIQASKGSTLVFSYVSMEKQQIQVQTNVINVKMKADGKMLDEVVAVGYGTMKKKLVTGATVQVSGDKLQKLSTTSAFTALQSQTPGVNITQNSGQPGEGFKVNIRGIGTIGNSDPLYVIDGFVGGSLNNLNPSDIESIDVLKDGASTAIYGARAANGVILVTTKQGKSGKIQVSYDGYVGTQNPYKQASLLNAKEYVNIQNEVKFNEGLNPIDWKTVLGTRYNSVMDGSWKGTNWLEEITNKNAPTSNHALNITGGNDASKFSLGVSHTEQEGIYGKPVQSKYGRTTVRLNSDHVILKGNGFDAIKVGQTLNYNYATKSGIGIGNQYWNDISNVLRGNPLIPVVDDAGNYFNQDDKTAAGMIDGIVFNAGNPVANMVYNRGSNESKSHNLNMAAYMQIQPVKGLIFKSQFSYNLSASSWRSYTPDYEALSSTDSKAKSSVSQGMSVGWNYMLENTLNYKFKLNSHTFDVLGGQSIQKWGMGEDLSTTNVDLNYTDFEHAYITNTQGILGAQLSGSPWNQSSLASFFGRINYDYKETYMASLVMRADGSSNFASGKRWGYFPSVSAGWVVSNEKFMESTKNWLDFLKLRASWGQNGNCAIGGFQYLSLIYFEKTAAYSFGNNKDSQSTGGFAKQIPNPDVTWETSEQTDLGFDAHFLNSRLSLSFDWYNKQTKKWLITPDVLASFGAAAPQVNGGTMQNKGYEIALDWKDKVGKDFTYNVNANMSFNHNEVTEILNSDKVFPGASNVLSQGTTEIFRAQVDHPVGFFYGYKSEGIFQNQAEIDAWKAAKNGILQNNVQPGDVKFSDINHDGVINVKDKTEIGNPNPDFLLGLNLNLGYKGFDFSISAYGAFGQQIAKSYRSFVGGQYENYTTEVYQRWHGEGTSNLWPRLTSGSNVNYQELSSIFIEDADYLKIKNITLGYDFKRIFKRMPLTQARLFVTAQNPFTFTKYSGMDPEIGSDAGTGYGWASGIDIGFYSSPRTYLVGVNLKF